jgi:alpha-L-fucosidase
LLFAVRWHKSSRLGAKVYFRKFRCIAYISALTFVHVKILCYIAAAAIMLSCGSKEVAPPQAFGPIPSAGQLEWHKMEMNAFVHFTLNTYTGKEWGYGDESPSLFNPSSFDADQWVKTFKDTGFKGVILTCKHHDGFCLWPSAYTEHSVKNSPFQNGNGDVVKEVAEACKRNGLKFGVYLSPWDRNRADYGTPAYIEYYRNQLKELFASYGPIFEMWFDGANGGDGYYGGANETRRIEGSTYYDWPATLDIVREMEPEVIFFSDAGPGVRWVGNERGVAGETNWNTITPDTLFAGKAGITDLLNKGHENGTAWIPAEVDVSIRPGWFYHAHEDSLVKSAEKLFDIYLTSVGRGSTLLLNIPPDQRGLIHENDLNSLQGFKELLEKELGTDLAKNANATSTAYRGNDETYGPSKTIDDDEETYWATDDETTTGSFEIELSETTTIKYVELMEYIQLGQRVKSFTIEARIGDKWSTIGNGTTVGFKRVLKVEPIETNKIRVTIADSKACPLISSVRIY